MFKNHQGKVISRIQTRDVYTWHEQQQVAQIQNCLLWMISYPILISEIGIQTSQIHCVEMDVKKVGVPHSFYTKKTFFQRDPLASSGQETTSLACWAHTHRLVQEPCLLPLFLKPGGCSPVFVRKEQGHQNLGSKFSLETERFWGPILVQIIWRQLWVVLSKEICPNHDFPLFIADGFCCPPPCPKFGISCNCEYVEK